MTVAAGMDLEEIRRRTHPLRPANLSAWTAALAVAALCWNQTGMGIVPLVEGWGNMAEYLAGNPAIADSGFFPPVLAAGTLLRYGRSMLETVEMAVLALVLSVAVAFPLSFFASRNTLAVIFPGGSASYRFLRAFLYGATRLFANLSRSINEVIWALLFVSAVGLGPMPGILALAVHTSGVLIKLFSEGIEGANPEPILALSATGAASPKVIRYAVVPQIAPYLVSMVLYRLESDLRSATILGFAGAGGVGMLLFDKLRSYENRDVCTLLVLIALTVAAIDRGSAWVRSKVS